MAAKRIFLAALVLSSCKTTTLSSPGSTLLDNDSGTFLLSQADSKALLNGTCISLLNNAPTERERLMQFAAPVTPQGTTRYWSYYYWRKAENGFPTILWIPGGPGLSAVDTAEHLNHLPPSAGVLMIDPRNLFCNANAKISQIDQTPSVFKESETTLFTHASDVVGMLNHINSVDPEVLKNYIIYGASYGTAVATVVGSSTDIVPPRAVILDGILGKSSQSYAELMAPSMNLWEDYRAALQPKYLQALDAMFAKANLKDGAAIFNIEAGGLVNFHGAMCDLLKNANFADKLNSYAKPDQFKFSERGRQLNRTINCQNIGLEFSNSKSTGNDLKFTADGSSSSLTLIERTAANTVCRKDNVGPGRAREIYDSANFKIRAPVIYVQSRDDIATPYAQAQYHFEKQKENSPFAAEHIYIDIDGAGHSPLSGYFQTSICRRDFWRAMKEVPFDPAKISASFDPATCPDQFAPIESILQKRAAGDIDCEHVP